MLISRKMIGLFTDKRGNPTLIFRAFIIAKLQGSVDWPNRIRKIEVPPEEIRELISKHGVNPNAFMPAATKAKVKRSNLQPSDKKGWDRLSRSQMMRKYKAAATKGYCG